MKCPDLVDAFMLYFRVDAPPNERYHSVRLLLPDVITLLVSIIAYTSLKKMYSSNSLPTFEHASLDGVGKVGVFKKIVQSFGELTIVLLIGKSIQLKAVGHTTEHQIMLYCYYLCWGLKW